MNFSSLRAERHWLAPCRPLPRLGNSSVGVAVGVLLATSGCGRDNDRGFDGAGGFIPSATGGSGAGASGGAATGGAATGGAASGVGGMSPGTGGAPFQIPEWVFQEGPGQQVTYAGVNLAGAEFGSEIPGTFNQDYTYPSVQSLGYFVEQGMDTVRLPFRWERLQRELNANFDEDELGRIRTFVDGAAGAGMTVILDPHNYARYDDEIIGSEAVPQSAFVDFWERLAAEFADDDHVIFGLMNEPHDLGDVGTTGWLAAANAAIAGIRSEGAEQLILVPGSDWTGAHSWLNNNAAVMSGVVDPQDNFAFEVHQYLDSDSSGRGSECVSATIGSERLQDFTKWARDGGYQAVLGEFGAPVTRTCLEAVDDMVDYMGKSDDVWLGWTWWAAGPWWGDYQFSIEPEDGEHKTQMLVLKRHLDPVK